MKLIVGLGNPGDQYQFTRHNAGFWLVDELAREWSASFHHQKSCESLLAEGKINGHSFVLAKPLTFMNRSGRAVQSLLQSFGLSHQDTLVILDDIFLNLGKLRLRLKGSSGGHKGLESVIQCFQTNVFPRLRLGVGLPQDQAQGYASHVLNPFDLDGLVQVRQMNRMGVVCAGVFMSEGPEAARKWLSDDQSKNKV